MAAKYKYYNRNPKRVHLQDCVCRAISTATGLCYEAVNNLLDLIANEYDCEKLCICCYHHLLDETLCYHKEDCNFKRTVKEIASDYSNNRLILRIDSHLTSAINGTILDIWDCSDELVDCFWIIQ